ncbi:MAG: hypothetical protein GXP62_19980, partial [Oligoflexia bacterium]|nr:hypothetical protein [Oligoflexia bacterium]
MHLVGVLSDDHLRKTADQADIVEDARYIDMLHALQPTATRLIRQVIGQKYEPPPLPMQAAQAAPQSDQHTTVPRGPRPEPLPDPLVQVAPRPDLSLDIIGGLAAGTPLFWVDPNTARTLGPTAEPDRFPFRLLVLTPGQAVTLASFRDNLSVSSLSSAADAEFVARVAARQADLHTVVIPLTEADGLGGRGQLHLRLHLAGPTPAWGVEGQDDVPVSVRIARRPQWCGALHLGLPAVSVCVELDGGDFDPVTGAAAISHLVRRS